MKEKISKTEKRELRKFGLITGLIVALLFGLLLPWMFSKPSSKWSWMVSSVLLIWALIAPSTLKIIYNVWMRIGLVLGWLTTKIVLSIVFYFVVTPMGLLMKIFREDPMRRKIDKEAVSYRRASVKPPKERMERTY